MKFVLVHYAWQFVCFLQVYDNSLIVQVIVVKLAGEAAALPMTVLVLTLQQVTLSFLLAAFHLTFTELHLLDGKVHKLTAILAAILVPVAEGTRQKDGPRGIKHLLELIARGILSNALIGDAAWALGLTHESPLILLRELLLPALRLLLVVARDHERWTEQFQVMVTVLLFGIV